MRDEKAKVKLLSGKYEWDKNDASRIWSFGPYGEGANCIVDMT